jgi:hypothetical protein
MKMYTPGGAEANVDKSQVSLVEAAGWTRKPLKKVNQDLEKSESSKSTKIKKSGLKKSKALTKK